MTTSFGRSPLMRVEGTGTWASPRCVAYRGSGQSPIDMVTITRAPGTSTRVEVDCTGGGRRRGGLGEARLGGDLRLEGGPSQHDLSGAREGPAWREEGGEGARRVMRRESSVARQSHARTVRRGRDDGAQHENNAITLLYTNCLWLKHHDDSISILDFEYCLYIPSILFCIQILVIFLDTVF